MNNHGTCKQCGGPLPQRRVQESVCEKCVDTYMKKYKWKWLLSAVLAAGLVGIPANITRAIEVSPPSPVPSLSPTVITVTYAAENSFVMVLGVVDGKMYLPDVNDAGPGVLTFSGPPGQYAVMGMEDGKRFQLTVVVEGEPDPDPDPEPDPTPPPPPPGKRWVFIIYESERNTPGFALAVQKLQQYQDKKHPRSFRFTDQNSVGPNGGTPAYLAKYLQAARQAGHELPVLVIASGPDGEGKTLALVPFDNTPGKMIEVLKRHGG